jgi:hypothetical protein
MKKYCVHILAFILVFPVTVFGWGGTGHKEIGEAAYRYLDRRAKDSLKYYLQDVSLPDAGLWMDQMRKNHDYDYMKPWHYIEFDKGQSYKPNNEENIINELNKVIDRLHHRNQYSKEQVAIDLKILIHLTEDLHMPLHAGYVSDTGGNAIHLTFNGQPTTLHWAWDNDILLQQNITTDTIVAVISKFTPQQLAEKRKTDVVLWMTESRSYLPDVYDFTGNTIDIAYANKNAPIIKMRLALASLRLSNLLNELFAN